MRLKLAQIEARLQALVEGSVARLFPSSYPQSDLASRLVKAMQAGAHTGTRGEAFAPNLYTLIAHPSQAQVLLENQALIESLSQVLQEAGSEAGFIFPSPPVIRIASDQRMKAGEVQVKAQNSRENLPQTSDLAIDPWTDAQDSIAAIPQGAFLIVDGTQIVPLTQGVINIGRRTDNQIVIDDTRISRVHAQLRAVKGRYVIFDLDSTGGTFVNGERVHRSDLIPGDVISLSGLPLVFGQDNGVLTETQDFVPFPSAQDRKGAVSFPEKPSPKHNG